VGDVGDDHFRGVVRKVAGRFVRGTCVWRHITEQAIDVGLASTPYDPQPSREVYAYGANGAEVRGIYARRWVVIPDAGGIGAHVKPTGIMVVGTKMW
jgi:hypothetical protein